MKKRYDFDYDMGEAKVSFEVDTDVFTPDMAKATLEFFTWDYDDEECPIKEVLKKYAIEAIRDSADKNLSINGAIAMFEDKEGFAKVDGSLGIRLTWISEYEFSDYNLEVSIVEV